MNAVSAVGELLRHMPQIASAPFSTVLHAWQRQQREREISVDGLPAVSNEFLKKELQLLNSHADSNWVIENALYTSAHFAAHAGFMPLLVQLHDELGVSMVEPDLHKAIPMHYAAREGNVDALEYLISTCKSDLRLVDDKRRNAAHLACAGGFPAVLELVDRHQVLVELCANEDNLRLVPVHVAASYGNDDCIRACAMGGVDISAVDSLNRHSVMYAAEQGRVNVLTLFVEEMGPSVLLSRDKFLATSVHYAARQGQTEALCFLAAHGVDLDAADKNGRTPAFWAVLGGKSKAHIDAIQYLRQQGADMDHRDTNDHSLLDVALSRYTKETNIVKFLTPILHGKVRQE